MGEAAKVTDGIRSGVRIPLELPVHIRWKSAGGYRQVQGKTGCISGNGLFVRVPLRPPRSTPITFTITLPIEITKVPLELHCQGRVVHYSQRGEGLGVGAVIDEYKFRRVH
jgi:PilZ domain-containing protein